MVLILWIFFTILVVALTILSWIRRRPTRNVLMVVLGSGGHTGEMFSLLRTCFTDLTGEEDAKDARNSMKQIDEFFFVVSNNDSLSRQKMDSIKLPFRYVEITRARDVHESFVSAIPKTIAAILQSFLIILESRPKVLLVNGPGVCVPLAFAAKLLSPRTQCIYVESVCRTRTLSLTGKLLYKLRLANHFFVQWPRLHEQYPRSRYMGLLI